MSATTQSPESDRQALRSIEHESTGALLSLPNAFWLLIFAVLPIVMIGVYSVTGSIRSERGPFTLGHFRAIFESDVLRNLFLRTLGITLLVSVACLVLALPVAYHLALRSRHAPLLLTLLLLPFLVGYIPRVLALRVVLGSNGVLGSWFSTIGLDPELVRPLLFTKLGTTIGLLYVQLPIMIALTFLAIERIDRRIFDAAADLGASSTRIFFTLVIPNSRGGILASLVLIVATTYGAYIEPALMGGASGQMAANVIAQRFVVFFDWGRGSALAMTALIVIVLFSLFVVAIVALWRVWSNRMLHA